MSATPKPPEPGRLNIGVVSAGRVGSSLAAALRAAGHTITGACAPSQVSRERLEAMLPGVPAMDPVDVAASCDVLLLAVPDDELGPLVAGLAKLQAFAPGQLVVHVAGRFGVGVLDPAAQLGAMPLALHPAMTFTGTSLDVARLAGCPFAVTAANTLLPIGQALAAEVGGHPVVVAEEDRGLYHAALSHAANHLVTLVGQSMRALEAVGVDDPGSYLAPLLQASLDGALSSGEAALTGPVARGDAGTVREHLASLDALAATGDYADIPPAYRALAGATAARVSARSLRQAPGIAEILTELEKRRRP